MINERLIFKIPYEFDPAPDDFSDIFGANYYEDWNFEDASSLVLSGSLITSITSSGLNGGIMEASGVDRPTLVSSVALGVDVAEFDGVSERLGVNGSTADYNFLHDGSGGCVIIVAYVDDANPDKAQVFLDNHGLTSANTGFSIYHDDRSSSSRNNRLVNTVAKSSAGNLSVQNLSLDNAFSTEEYNSLITVIDADNATAADRSILNVNNGTDIKLNTKTNTPSTGNASRDLNLARSGLGAFYFKGKVARVIIADTIPTAGQLADVQTRLDYDYGTFPIS